MHKGNGSIDEIRKKITKIYEFISKSYHESGHTIYALLHLIKVNSVSVYEDKKMKRIHGVTYYDYQSDFDLIRDIELRNVLVLADIGMSYAGLIAEKVLFRSISGSNQIPMFISDGSADDNKAARELIKKYNLSPPGQKRAKFKAKMIRDVQRELHLSWQDVSLVAHELFSRRKLSYADLQEILTSKSHNKKFWKEQFKKIILFYDNQDHLDEKKLKFILEC